MFEFNSKPITESYIDVGVHKYITESKNIQFGYLMESTMGKKIDKNSIIQSIKKFFTKLIRNVREFFKNLKRNMMVRMKEAKMKRVGKHLFAGRISGLKVKLPRNIITPKGDFTKLFSAMHGLYTVLDATSKINDLSKLETGPELSENEMVNQLFSAHLGYTNKEDHTAAALFKYMYGEMTNMSLTSSDIRILEKRAKELETQADDFDKLSNKIDSSLDMLTDTLIALINKNTSIEDAQMSNLVTEYMTKVTVAVIKVSGLCSTVITEAYTQIYTALGTGTTSGEG